MLKMRKEGGIVITEWEQIGPLLIENQEAGQYFTKEEYQFGRIPEAAVIENSIITGGRISITALVKDGVVIRMFTNIPVAG